MKRTIRLGKGHYRMYVIVLGVIKDASATTIIASEISGFDNFVSWLPVDIHVPKTVTIQRNDESLNEKDSCQADG